MKKKKFLTGILCLCTFAFSAMAIGGGKLITPKAYAVDEAEVGTEVEYDSLYINDLSNTAGDGATIGTNNNVDSIAAYGRVGFAGNYTNVEVNATLNFSTVGNTVFRLRATGDITSNTFDNAGYFFRWYSHGQFDFVKNSTVIYSAQWGPLSSMVANSDYKFSFKTVNTSTGAVHIVIKIADATTEGTFVDYYDADAPITTGGMFAISSEGSVLSATGLGFDEENAFDLSNVGTPFTSSNFPGATVATDGKITTATNGGYSGVAYAYQSTGEITIKAQVTPIETSQMVFMIGATKTNSHEVNRPDVVSSGADGWGWDNPGYAYYWNANGQRYFSRGAGYDSTGLINYAWLAGYTNNTTYTIEFGLKRLIDGQVRVYFKVNNALVLNYLDSSKTFNFNDLGGAPAGLYSYSEILSVGSMLIEPTEAPAIEKATITSSNLSTPNTTGTSTVVDRNGAVESFANGGIAYYNANKNNFEVKFKANFSTIGTNFIVGIATQGSLNGDSVVWTNTGYSIYFYPNSQIILYKNGQKICEGWALGWKTFEANTDYLFTISVSNVSNSATQLKAMIDDQLMLNFVDANNPINQKGWFTLDSNGFAGSLSPVGVNVPTVTTDLEDNTFDCKSTVNLSYTMEGKTESDEVQYFIDQTNTTATAEIISGNVLSASTSGQIAVYVLVNGVYSRNLVLTATKVVPIIENATTPIIVGGEQVILTAKMEDDSNYTTKVFHIQNLSGEATIDATTGAITPTKAGNIKVWVTIDGVDSIMYTMQISPKIKLNMPYLAVDGEVQLSYIANCALPDETITAIYTILSMQPNVEGEIVAEIDANTGKIYGKAIGKFVVKVTVNGQTFTASNTLECSVSVPVVTIGVVNDTFVGKTITITPQIEGGITITSAELIIKQGADLVQVNGLNIKAIKAGHVSLKAKINGKYVSSISQAFDIGIISPTIIATDLRTNKTQQLSVMLNDDRYQVETIVYSIVSGKDLATIVGNTLTALDKMGQVTIKAVVDNTYEAYLTINIISKTQLTIANDYSVQKGKEIKIGFYYDADEGEKITSVKFIIVKGNARLSVVNADDPENCYANVKVYGRSPVKIKVVVNGHESITQTIIPQNKFTDAQLALIIAASILVIGCIAAIVTVVVLKRKAKNKNLTIEITENSKQPDSNLQKQTQGLKKPTEKQNSTSKQKTSTKNKRSEQNAKTNKNKGKK